MNKHRIVADFHNADEQGRLRLTCIGTIRDVAKLGIGLHDGMELVLVDDDLEVDSIVEWNPDEACWVAAIDWDAIRDVPMPETRRNVASSFWFCSSPGPDGGITGFLALTLTQGIAKNPALSLGKTEDSGFGKVG